MAHMDSYFFKYYSNKIKNMFDENEYQSRTMTLFDLYTQVLRIAKWECEHMQLRPFVKVILYDGRIK